MSQRIDPGAVVPITTLVPGARTIEGAITTLFDQFEGRLKGFALAAVRDEAAADDIVQESFLRLLREMRAGRTPDNSEAWLFRVSANLIATRGRRRSVADRFKALLVDRGVATSTEDLVVVRDANRRLSAALARLRPDARAALLLAAQGVPAAEIGPAIGRTEIATRTFICRSRVRLRELIEVDEERVR